MAVVQVRHCQTCRGLMARRAIAPLDYCTESLRRDCAFKKRSQTLGTGIDASTSRLCFFPYGDRVAIEIRNILHGRTMILQILQRLIPINDASPHTICQDYRDADREGMEKGKILEKGREKSCEGRKETQSTKNILTRWLPRWIYSKVLSDHAYVGVVAYSV